MKEVILVDENDNVVGREEKIKAHKEGKLHRAFSIFVLNSRNELLLQKRAGSKYHSPNLWTNTCCSHPAPGDSMEEAIHSRLREEMGFDCDLKRGFTFVYKVEFENGLTEYEYDHVYIGKFDGTPDPDETEVEDWKWVALDRLKDLIKSNPEDYTYWFSHVFEKFYQYCQERT